MLLQLKVDGESDADPTYRQKRHWLLQVACGAAKNRFPELKTVIGIAIDAPKFSANTAEDFLLMDCSEWGDERRAHFERENKLVGFFQSPSLKMRKVTAQNFPEVPDTSASDAKK